LFPTPKAEGVPLLLISLERGGGVCVGVGVGVGVLLTEGYGDIPGESVEGPVGVSEGVEDGVGVVVPLTEEYGDIPGESVEGPVGVSEGVADLEIDDEEEVTLPGGSPVQAEEVSPTAQKSEIE